MTEPFRPTWDERQRMKRNAEKVRRPRKCDDCGINPADEPSRLCPGCDAYREHTGQI